MFEGKAVEREIPASEALRQRGFLKIGRAFSKLRAPGNSETKPGLTEPSAGLGSVVFIGGALCIPGTPAPSSEHLLACPALVQAERALHSASTCFAHDGAVAL